MSGIIVCVICCFDMLCLFILFAECFLLRLVLLSFSVEGSHGVWFHTPYVILHPVMVKIMPPLLILTISAFSLTNMTYRRQY